EIGGGDLLVATCPTTLQLLESAAARTVVAAVWTGDTLGGGFKPDDARPTVAETDVDRAAAAFLSLLETTADLDSSRAAA
ncbi:MAG: hypothetical protein ACRDD1_22735, partial [Planctomycetia bacterium]